MTNGVRFSVALFFVLVGSALAGCGGGEHLNVRVTEGRLSATCNWDGTCHPEFRFFKSDGRLAKLWFVFGSSIDTQNSLSGLRANMQVSEAHLADSLTAREGLIACGETVPQGTLSSFRDGRLAGRIDGAVRLCKDSGGDVLDDRGIDPLSFTVTFDLAFDPTESPAK
jgi:hypothetical protein